MGWHTIRQMDSKCKVQRGIRKSANATEKRCHSERRLRAERKVRMGQWETELLGQDLDYGEWSIGGPKLGQSRETKTGGDEHEVRSADSVAWLCH